MAVKRETVRTGWQEALGITLLAVCVLGILSLFSYSPRDIPLIAQPPNAPPANFIGPVGAWFGFLCFMGFGVCGYIVPAALAYIGLLCIFKREGSIWPKAVWMLVMLLGVVMLAELNPETWFALRANLNIGTTGGAIGDLLTERLFVPLMGTVGTSILAITLVTVSIVLLFEIRPVAVASALGHGAHLLYEKFEIARKSRLDRKRLLEEEEKEVAKRRRRLEETVKEEVREKPKREREEAPKRRAMMPEPEPDPAPQPVKVKAAPAPEPEPIPEPEPEPAAADPRPSPLEPSELLEQAAKIVKAVKLRRNMPDPEPVDRSEKPLAVPPGGTTFTLPPMTLLDDLPPAKDRELKGDFQVGAQVLKETLSEFGIEVEITNVERGPVVTRYEVLPAAGVKVEKIGGLANNIALAMKAESIRVQAPVPGKGVVGVEISNPKTNKVFLREILESDEWKASPAALPLVLGQDVGGRVLIADLARMPHLLIAGATGSGKTVCMNSILAGLLMSRTPDQMRLMLIDPKIVEFSGYNGLPHLVVPVITDAKKVSLGLRWAINEMEKRYKIFAKVGVRNIEAFNSRPIVKQTELFGDADVPPEEPPEPEDVVPDRVPYIVIVVDELADLMLVAQAEVENQIARLAQLSRAVGIHMILATQRPSVNVITGTIKANFPARIAFQVAQANDSRTILDAMGADKLLGKGDMLFLNPGVKQLIRAQGTLTTDGEIHRVVENLKNQGVPQYETAIKDKIEGKSADLPDLGEDDLLDAALEIIRQTRRASTSSLQRRLRIGYTRAARIMDLLEQKGVVGPAQGSDPREILIDLDGEVPQNQVKEVE